MRACIVSIGDEVLSGQIINTNASYLAQKLTAMGFTVDLQEVVSDFDPTLKERLNKLSQTCELIVCTGGLGPTVDDMTRNLFASLSGAPLVFNEHLCRELEERFGQAVYHRLQSMVPDKAHLLHNPCGTACGLAIELNSCYIVALPGVPYEMKEMFEKELYPYLKARFAHLTQYHEKVINFFDIVEVSIDPFIKQLQKTYPSVAFGIYPSYGVVRVVCKSLHLHELQDCEEFFKKNFSSQVFSSKHETIEETVFSKLKECHLKLALAESITGGSISSRLVALSGVSSHFLGSIIAYSNDLKIDLLGVDRHVLKIYGAVSPEVCELMLEGILHKTGADLACAITGIAGPDGGSSEKPVGLVYVGVKSKHGACKIFKCQFKGDRAIIREKAATYAFGYIIQYLEKLDK